jgi:hypothetical protein
LRVRIISGQCAYQIAILQDRKALYPGYISTQRRISLPVGQEHLILVTVCGSAITVCSKTRSPLADNKPESARLRAKLLVGAEIEASLTGRIPGGIQAMSMPVQPVIAQADAASWRWLIQPDRAGVFPLILTLTPLLAGSGVPLHTSFSYTIEVKVTGPTPQKATATSGSGGATSGSGSATSGSGGATSGSGGATSGSGSNVLEILWTVLAALTVLGIILWGIVLLPYARGKRNFRKLKEAPVGDQTRRIRTNPANGARRRSNYVGLITLVLYIITVALALFLSAYDHLGLTPPLIAVLVSGGAPALFLAWATYSLTDQANLSTPKADPRNE